MKKLLLFPLLLLVLVACGKQTDVPPPGEYLQIAEHPTKEVWYPAVLTLESDGAFRFTFDPLSSYSNTGTFVREGDVLTCTTDDGMYTFRFRILAEDRLTFLAEGSSPVTYFDTFLVTPITDGAEFVLQTE